MGFIEFLNPKSNGYTWSKGLLAADFAQLRLLLQLQLHLQAAHLSLRVSEIAHESVVLGGQHAHLMLELDQLSLVRVKRRPICPCRVPNGFERCIDCERQILTDPQLEETS